MNIVNIFLLYHSIVTMPAVIKNVHLKFVKSIIVEFCPWQANVESTREFQTRVAHFTTRQSNMKCSIKTKVKNDGSPPSITILFDDSKQFIFKSSNLTSTEMLQRFGTLNLQREKALEQSEAGR